MTQLPFPEPSQPDNGTAVSDFEWICRSTSSRAHKYRSYLNFNIMKLPGVHHRKLISDLRARFRETLFELNVARVFQELGGRLTEVEVALGDGRRPDFRFSFGPSELIVEAVAPGLQPEVRKHFKDFDRLGKAITPSIPAGFSAVIHEIPAIGPSDSLRDLKRALQDMFSKGVPEDTHSIELTGQLGDDDLELTLVRTNGPSGIIDQRAIAFWPGECSQSIRDVIKRKKRQIRRADVPALIAMLTGFETDIDYVGSSLFGQDSIFGPAGNHTSPLAGVLAFRESMFFPSLPVLFVRPGYEDVLVQELTTLPRRLLVDGTVVSFPPSCGDLIGRLKPVTHQADDD